MSKACDILVVEDDVGLRQAVIAILRNEGFSVASARNGLEALGALEVVDPRVMLVDFFMPEMNGAELIRALNMPEKRRSIPVIATSATERPESFPGVTTFLRKPFSLDQLLKAVRKHLEPARLARNNRTKRSGARTRRAAMTRTNIA
jgi:CheY-like chemotaxis protein